MLFKPIIISYAYVIVIDFGIKSYYLVLTTKFTILITFNAVFLDIFKPSPRLRRSKIQNNNNNFDLVTEHT